MQKKILLILSLILIITHRLPACTTAIISGKYTLDGRPLLWKHRDSGSYENKLMFFDDGKYSYIGLINSKDSLGLEIWAGSNSAGFSIINAASYNLKQEETELKDQEGLFMKQALQKCANLKDFERLLAETSGERGIEANFGVIDAFGGAAYYETDDTSYTKFDANDPKLAPFGYIIRTNYSFAGEIENGYGYIRFQTTDALFYQAFAQQKLSYRFILQQADRNLYHSLTKTDLKSLPYPFSKEEPQFVCMQDYINRFSSVSSTLVQGVKPGEAVAKTTIWTILGFQLCSVAIPTWVAAGENLPSVLVAPGCKNAPLCQKALKLKKQCFPITRGSGKKYLNLSVLLNQQGDGVLQLLPMIEEKIIRKAEQNIKKWRKNGFNPKEAKSLYNWFDEVINEGYEKYFGL